MGEKMIQLDFFQKDEMTLMIEQIEKLEQSCEKVRKGQFAKLGALQKKLDDQESRLAILEKYICYDRR